MENPGSSYNSINSTSFLVNLSQENMLRRAILETNALKYLNENQNIDNLRVKYPTMYFLNEVKRILPNLKKLSLISLSPGFSSNSDDGGSIRMNNIEELTIESLGPIPKYLIFDHLKSIKLQIDSLFGINWSKFLKYNINPSLTNFYLYSEELPHQTFLFIGRKFPHLTSVNIICESIMNRGVAQFVEESDHLEHFELESYISDFYITLLEKHFKYSEWKFEVDCGAYLDEDVEWRSESNPCWCTITLTR